ncbi:MAG: cyclase family protein [Pyrinomonadaceae bacterium]
MILTFQISGRDCKIETGTPIDISIPLRFNGNQPSAYGVEPATSKPVEAGDLVGDTRLGGSVNFEQYTFIPHCNGTHTECIGHITNERISVLDCLEDVFIPAVLVSVEPEAVGDDKQITRGLLERALTYVRAAIAGDTRATVTIAKARASARAIQTCALIVRTLPNDETKLARRYDSENIPPYFTSDAMEFIVESGFKHLLVDLPSIDRLFDEGKLTNHRIFWNVDPGSKEVNNDSRLNSTITELIYVPNEIKDGEYLLNLQIAPFESDCAPSRPILLRRNLSANNANDRE